MHRTTYSAGPSVRIRSPRSELVRRFKRKLVRELGFMRDTLAGTELRLRLFMRLIESDARGGMTAANSPSG